MKIKEIHSSIDLYTKKQFQHVEFKEACDVT